MAAVQRGPTAWIAAGISSSALSFSQPSANTTGSTAL